MTFYSSINSILNFFYLTFFRFNELCMNKLCIVKKCTMDSECPLRSRCHPKLNYCRGERERPYNFEFILHSSVETNLILFFQIWNVKINRIVNQMNFVKKIYVLYQRANIAVITSIVVSKISVHEKMTKGILPFPQKYELWIEKT